MATHLFGQLKGKFGGLLVLMLVLMSAAAARGEDIFYVLSPDQIKLTAGAFPKQNQDYNYTDSLRGTEMHPRVVLDGPGEAYVQCTGDDSRQIGWAGNFSQITSIAIRTSGGGNISGRLFVPKVDDSGMEVLKFTVPGDAHPGTEQDFFKVKEIYFQRLMDRQYPGSAYFRHEAREAKKHVTTQPSDLATNNNPSDVNTDQEDETLSLLGGGRAVSENLQLDRMFASTGAGEATVDVNSIKGISITPMDWTKKNQGLKPKTDALAGMIPADQPAIFFPSFQAMVDLADEANRSDNSILKAMETQDALTRQQYEKQLGISLSGFGRLLGPHMIKSVAMTASDPYLKMGTDVALLLETDDPAALEELLKAQLAMAATKSPRQTASSDPAFFASAVSPDRTLCCYMGALGQTIVVTNSPVQFQHIKDAVGGKSPAIVSAPEYVFFRDRYKLGDENETAFVVLTDATIRRWCGPQWRIADSRRTRAAAVMSELQAQHMGEIVSGKMPEDAVLHSDFRAADIGELRLTPGGVTSSTYGTLDFMTPIAETPLTKVTQAEADLYGRWRDSYEQNWRWFFDPIAVRLGVSAEKLSTDLTIMPLIAGSDYAQFVNICGSSKIGPTAGDPHPDLAQYVLAIDRKSETVHPAENFVSGMVPGVGVDPLSWLGQWVTAYADDDPFWKELSEAKETGQFFESNISRIPVGVQVDVSNGFKLTAFIVAVRGFIEQTAPQMVAWESMTYKDQAYVKVSPTPKAIAQTAELKNAAIYYAITGDAFVVTPNEALLKRALDRRIATAAAKADAEKAGSAPATQPSPWLGESIAAKFDAKSFDLLAHVSHEEKVSDMQNLAWQNLPILNEYRRLYPDQDPVQLHERLWGVRLADPAGGQYVWNENWQTMESSVYGSPCEPKEGPAMSVLPEGVKAANLGVTFEESGLRGAAVIERGSSK